MPCRILQQFGGSCRRKGAAVGSRQIAVSLAINNLHRKYSSACWGDEVGTKLAIQCNAAIDRR